MIFELNPLKWFAKADVPAALVAPLMDVSEVRSAAVAVESVMSTAAVIPAVAVKKATFLDHVGNFFKALLHIGVEVAQVAEPVIAVEFPQVVPIYSSAIGLAIAAQATAVSATGTGPQKLAQVAASLVPQVQTWAKDNGIVWNDADITKWASAVVDTLNLIPSPPAPPATPAVA